MESGGRACENMALNTAGAASCADRRTPPPSPPRSTMTRSTTASSGTSMAVTYSGSASVHQSSDTKASSAAQLRFSGASGNTGAAAHAAARPSLKIARPPACTAGQPVAASTRTGTAERRGVLAGRRPALCTTCAERRGKARAWARARTQRRCEHRAGRQQRRRLAQAVRPGRHGAAVHAHHGGAPLLLHHLLPHRAPEAREGSG